MIRWKDEYSIGVARIDEQHKKLFEIADRAFELMKNQFYTDKFDKIVEILEELKDYTVFHFKFEEEFMQSRGYKKFLSHKVEHTDFLEKVNSIDLNTIDNDQDKYIMDILNFVVDWIDKHILEKDKLIMEE
ncbi:bacteriohemerythrin [Oxobacter pfennigii]|uniref:Bacteriohemerythrin n=1 Tax=Oxobacter pfennigii TaxID=36849 RepID=A0A0P8W3B5_9CLOT|nr:bacteriohemerythrin [Oxobacter pfennigii]KPU43074.1 bacteriohemerythrin [Oxobacter pfennigii]